MEAHFSLEKQSPAHPGWAPCFKVQIYTIFIYNPNYSVTLFLYHCPDASEAHLYHVILFFISYFNHTTY